MKEIDWRDREHYVKGAIPVTKDLMRRSRLARRVYNFVDKINLSTDAITLQQFLDESAKINTEISPVYSRFPQHYGMLLEPVRDQVNRIQSAMGNLTNRFYHGEGII